MTTLNDEAETEDDGSFLRGTPFSTRAAGTDDPTSDQNIFMRSLIDSDIISPQKIEAPGATLRFPQIHRVIFSMNLLNNVGREVHKFTSIRKEIGSTPKEPVETNYAWMKYPSLAQDYQQAQKSAPIFLFEAYLKMRDALPEHDSFLAVQLTIEFAERTAFDKWQSSTRIYEEGGTEVDLSKAIYLSQSGDGRWEHLECLEPPQSNTTRLTIPLKSKWWSTTLSKIILNQHEAKKSADPELINEQDEKARHCIEGISVLQEIWAAPRGTDLPRQQIAVFLWNFKQTHRADTAMTSWRRIQAPTSSSQQMPLLSSRPRYFSNTQVALGAAIHPSSMPTFPTSFAFDTSMLSNNATSLPVIPQIPKCVEAPPPHAFPSVPDCIFEGATTSYPLQEPYFLTDHSDALFPASLGSWQSQVASEPQGGISSNLQDIPWSTSEPFDEDFCSSFMGPWQPELFPEPQDIRPSNLQDIS